MTTGATIKIQKRDKPDQISEPLDDSVDMQCICCGHEMANHDLLKCFQCDILVHAECTIEWTRVDGKFVGYACIDCATD